jgi:hypothetical protein
MLDSNSPKIKAKKGLMSFLPRLGSKERMTGLQDEASSIFRTTSKERLLFDREENASRETSKDTLGMPVFEESEETKLDDEFFIERTVVVSSPEGSSSTVAKSPNLFTRRFRPNKEKSQVPREASLEMTQLEHAIRNQDFRHKLVDALLSRDDDFSIKIRFVSAVDEYLSAEGRDKKDKATNIVKMFVKKDSMFYMSGIPQQYEQNLLSRKFEVLETLRAVCLNELVHDEVVLRTVEDVMDDST